MLVIDRFSFPGAAWERIAARLCLAVLLLLAPLSAVHAQPAAASPAVTITVVSRHGQGTPHRQGCTHTGGGNIDVAQPAPDTLVVTMTGVAVATGAPCCPGVAAIDFDLAQCFEVVFEKPEVKTAKLTIEGRVIGLLRSHCKGGGSAEESGGCATVGCGPVSIITLCVPAHSVAGGESLSINDRDGPLAVPVTAGPYTLHQTFHVSATHPKCVLPCKAASAEFAPDPALDVLWISYWEPFHGAIKKDFGFQVTLKVAPDSDAPAEKPEKKGGNGKP